MRGERGNPALKEGMKAYARGDCHASVEALRQVTGHDPDLPTARLYSGVCLMHDGDLAGAAQALNAASLAAGTAEQEAAWYYLAQVALLRNDGNLARHYLTLAISRHGDFEDRATGQLKQIPANEFRH
jgi:predicted Zn-dependent protease